MGKKKASKRRKARERAAAEERQRQAKTAANLQTAKTAKANLDAEFGSRSTTATTGEVQDVGREKTFKNVGGGKKKRFKTVETGKGARRYDFSVMGDSPVLKRNLMSDMNPNNRNIRRTRPRLDFEPGASSIGDTGNASETPMNNFGLDRRNLTNRTQVGLSGNAAPSTTDQNPYTAAATMDDDNEERRPEVTKNMARAAATSMLGI